MKIYKVVLEDRHVEDQIEVFASLEQATERFLGILGEYGETEWVEEDIAGWLRYARDECEDGPNVRIEEGELDLGPECRIAVFVESRFRVLATASSQIEAVAFAQGFCAAANIYNSSASLYLLPDDLEEMRKDEQPAEVKLALEEAGLR